MAIDDCNQQASADLAKRMHSLAQVKLHKKAGRQAGRTPLSEWMREGGMEGWMAG